MASIGPRPQLTAHLGPITPIREEDLDGLSAGQKILARFDAALKEAGREAGQRLAWSEHERHRLAVAAELADRAEALEKVLKAALAEENPKGSVIARVSAEQRLLHRAVADHLSHVNLAAGAAKSVRHQRAVNARWGNN